MSNYIDDLVVENTLDAPVATGSVKGLMSATDKTKIDTVASGATANSTDAQLRDRATHTGTQLALTISDFSTATDARISLQKGAANGLVPLDGATKISSAYLPAIAITDTFVVASQAAQVALTAETGDIAVRTDLNKSYILKVNDPTIFANWQELLTPTDTILSVNGQTGVVVLTTTNISEGTNLYYTQGRFDTAFAAKTTTNLTEGTNLYYTQARFDSAFTAKSTTNLSEGTNLYFTTARVLATALTGFVASTNTTIAATDTVLQAFQKAQAQVTAREPSITSGTTSQYWRGDKSFQTLDTLAVIENTNLYYTQGRFDTAFSAKSTTNLTEGTNLYFTTARVLATALTGFAASTNTAIAATDTVLQGLQKLQAQVTAREATITAGTTTQYYRGDKSFQTLDTLAVTENTNLYFTNGRAQAAITGGASTIVTANLTASRALSSDATGKVAVATTTLAELNFVSGVTSAIQTQINSKLATTLATNNIFVGSAGSIATAVAMSGDATIVASGALTLATVNANVGSFGSASSVSAITVNAKGLVTSAASTAIQIAESQVTNLVTDLSNKQPLAANLTALAAFVSTGLIAQTVSGTFAARTITGTASNIVVTNGDGIAGNPTINLATAGTAGTYGSATQVPVFTTDAFGRITSVTNTTITGGSSVTSVFGRTGVVVAATNDYTWAQINKTTSSFADITTRSATDINSGTLADVRLTSNVALKNIDNAFSAVQTINVTGASSILNIAANNSTTNIAKIVFTGTSSTGDFQISSDGGDIFWQGGGSRNLQMAAYHGMDLLGGRVTGTSPTFVAGTSGAYNTRILNTSDSIGLIVRANATQTANLVEVQNSSGTALAGFTATGIAFGITPTASTHLTTKLYVDTKSISGDVTGTLAASTVAKIQNRTVATTAPTSGQALAWNGATSQWEPQTVGGGSGVTSITVSASTLTLTNTNNTYQLFTGTVGGQSVILPDATTLIAGADFFLANKSDTVISIFYNGGALAATLYPDQYLECLALDVSTAAGKWVIETATPNIITQINITDDFISAGTASGAIGQMGWTLSSGTTAVQASTGSTRGILRLNSSTANNGTGAIQLGVNHFLNNGGSIVYEARVQFAALGGTGAAGFTARFGLGDIVANADQTNGIYFEYAGTAAGTINWSLKTANAGTRTTTSTAAAVAATTFYKLTWVLNAAGTSVGFYINNNFIANIATNIPTAAIGPIVQITTNNANVAAKTCDVDYIYITNNFNTAR